MPPVLIDECMPAAQFREFFEARGYTVYTVGEYLPKGSEDDVVLAAAAACGAIVVTNDGDFRRLLDKAPGSRGRLKRAGRIVFACDHSKAIHRLGALIDDIEREYREAVQHKRRFLVRISNVQFSVTK